MKSEDSNSSSILLALKQMAKSFSPFPGGHQHEREELLLQEHRQAIREKTEQRIDNSAKNWLRALLNSLDCEWQRAKTFLAKEEGCDHYSSSQLDSMTIHQMLALHEEVESLAADFNAALSGYSELEALRITTVRFMEPDGPEAEQGPTEPKLSYRRCRATSQSWSLVLRSSPGHIDIFLVPSNELLSIPASETSARQLVSLRPNLSSPDGQWEIDLFSHFPGEKSLLMKELFRELLLKSAHQTAVSLGYIYPNDSDLALGFLKELYLAKQSMAQKLVSRHEELTHGIARDLHDVVIAEVMLLKRTLANHNLLPGNEEIDESLETLSARLREICYNLAPRDLEDWGLKTIVEDLLERVGKLTGTDFSLEYEDGLPKLALPVQLHIYRIIQECLNNIAKYANATKIAIKFLVINGRLMVTVADNGTGFAASADRAKGLFERGMGLSTINERTEMIRCFHPASLSIDSDPGRGTVVTLQIGIFEA